MELAKRGALVKLISGPTQIRVNHPNIQIFPVTSASEMFEQAVSHFKDTDIAILSAAVADYQPISQSPQKLKKSTSNLEIKLKPTKDILKSLGQMKKEQFLMGFALETDNENINAQNKLKSKNCDAIVLNSLNDQGAGFGHDTNKISILGLNHPLRSFELKSKSEVAIDIVNYLEKEALKK